MTREELSESAKKEYDELVRRMFREFEEKIPKPRGTLDMRPDKVRQGIAEKYLPELRRILAGEEQEESNGKR